MALLCKAARSLNVPCNVRLLFGPIRGTPDNNRGVPRKKRVVKTYDGPKHFPLDTSERAFDKIQDFDKVKKEQGREWPFYGGRITTARGVPHRFPQKPLRKENRFAIVEHQRHTKTSKTVRYGAAPLTYPTVLVYPDGATITIPYHRPVGTIFLPGDGSETVKPGKTKAESVKKTTFRRVKVSKGDKMFGR